MLYGEFRHSLDAKGRVFIPARWKDELKGTVVVTKGLDRCLYVMPKETFEAHAARINEQPLTQAKIRQYSRLIYSGSSEEPVDRSNRISILPNLREYAGLEKEVVWVGLSNRAELWTPKEWERYRAEAEKEYEATAEQLEI